MKRDTPILEMVRGYAESGAVRFHMPGHKGDTGYFGGEALRADITEIEGADNLLRPDGVILRSQELHAKRVGAAHSFYCVNGSTSGVLAALCAALAGGGKVIMARDCHISAINALVFTGAEPVFVDVAAERETGLLGACSAEGVLAAIAANSDARAVYVTYPNYFGLCCDLKQIAQAAHQAGLPLIVDGAHSAAFPYSGLLPDDPGKAGADVWVASAHKTLPAMNQCAVLNVSENSRLNAADIERFLHMFTTTSPSYLLLSSMDYASAYMAECGAGEIFRVASLAESFYERSYGITGLSFPVRDISGRANVIDCDVMKLVIDVSRRGVTGFLAGRVLRESGVYPELCDVSRVLCLLSVADTEEAFDRLFEALDYLPKGIFSPSNFNAYDFPKGEAYLSPREASLMRFTQTPVERAGGLISAACVGVYPPGVPAIIPGQEINEQMIEYITTAQSLGYDTFGLCEGKILIGEG